HTPRTTHQPTPPFPTRRSSDLSQIINSSTHQAIPSTMSGATFVAGSPSTFGVGCIVHDWIAQGAKHAITIHGEGFSSSGATVTVDRKSTRLNSSHQIISYAVFC